MRRGIRKERGRAAETQIAACMVVGDQNPLADQRGKRFGDPVRTLEVKVHDFEVRPSKQPDEFCNVAGRPFRAGKRMHLDSECLERFGEWPAAVHHGDLNIESASIAMAEHVQQSSLRPSQVKMIDDM